MGKYTQSECLHIQDATFLECHDVISSRFKVFVKQNVKYKTLTVKSFQFEKVAILLMLSVQLSSASWKSQ